jgi:NAD(P)-dependent dehydrogenase (short-subunit alcohol dehydrogenase family)
MSEPAERRRTALVTGGSRGIGAAVAQALAASGFDVAITYATNSAAAAQIVDLCRVEGAAAHAFQADLADLEAVPRLFGLLDDRFDRLDVLVNNAGVLPPAAQVCDIDSKRATWVLTVNALAYLCCAREAVVRMSTSKGGSGGVIVNMSSRAAVRGAAGEFVDYAMSKAAVDVMTIGLAQEVGSEGIRVVGIRPGLIVTDMNDVHSGRLERLLDTVPMGRPGTVSEVAEVVAWLVSPGASYLTGVTIDVSGGR